MKKRVLGFILMIVLAVSFCLPAAAADGTTINYENAADLYDYLKNWKGYDVTVAGNTVTLQKDIVLDDNTALELLVTTDERVEVILDLNGKKLSGKLDEFWVFGVTNGVLTITDSSANGGGIIENTSQKSGIALYSDERGKMNVKGGTAKAQFGMMLDGGGECTVSGGRLEGVIIGIFMLNGVCNINGGTVTGGGHGLSSAGGAVVLRDAFVVNGDAWDGINAEGVDVIFGDVTGGKVSGGKYGVYTQNGNIIFNGVEECEIGGDVAAVMIEAKDEGFGIRLTDAAVNAEAGQMTTTVFDERENPVCTSFSAFGSLALSVWRDRGVGDPERLPAGTQTLALSASAAVFPADEPPAPWAQADVERALRLRLVPDALNQAYGRQITRAEFCVLAVTLYESVKGEITERVQFNDTADVNVEKAAAVGVVNGLGDGGFSPENQLTREQAAAMLSRLANAMGHPLPQPDMEPFADYESISSWAYNAVCQVQAAGVMNGMGENNFGPQGQYTREQSIVTILRLYNVVTTKNLPA